MSTIFSKIFNQGNQKHPHLTREFSFNEFSQCYGSFRYHYKERLNKPCADNNSLINFDLKCRDFLMINGSLFMIFAGIATYGFRHRLGHIVDH